MLIEVNTWSDEIAITGTNAFTPICSARWLEARSSATTAMTLWSYTAPTSSSDALPQAWSEETPTSSHLWGSVVGIETERTSFAAEGPNTATFSGEPGTSLVTGPGNSTPSSPTRAYSFSIERSRALLL